MRIEERKRVTERDGIRLTSYFTVIVPETPEEIAIFDQIGPLGTFIGTVKYAGSPYLEIQLQGPAKHAEVARDAI